MKKATYTPGAWCIDQFGVVLGSKGEFIAEIFGPDDDNFDLIVSAPELYEALYGLCASLRSGVTHEEIMAGIDVADKKARAALSRARGEG